MSERPADDQDASSVPGAPASSEPHAAGLVSAPAFGSGAWGGVPDGRPPRDAGEHHPFLTAEPTRYALRQVIGWGGMGRVSAVHDQRLNRDVALKAIAERRDGDRDQNLHEQIRGRLAQEAWITAQLEHPGIVPVYDAGVDAGGALYYTMRLIRGRSLERALADTDGLPARLRLLRHFGDACEAIAYAHSVGIIHRDIKPANVMVGEFGETQVVDWGLARPVDDGDAEWRGRVVPEAHGAQTIFGAVVGTPAYMSPEQARGDAADLRSDVWSLGAVLWELLAGRPPFQDSDTARILARIQHEGPPPLAQHAPDAPPELVAIAVRALSHAPEDRYPNAKALVDDINRYLDGRVVGAYAYSPFDHLRRFVRAKRTPLFVALAGLVAVAVVAVLAFARTAGERDRAVAAEARARDALTRADLDLGRALAQQALALSARGQRPEAEIVAAHALRLAHVPEARGVLASWSAQARPLLLRSDPAPAERPQLSSRGERVFSIADGALTVWDVTDAGLTPRPRSFIPAGVGSAQIDDDRGRIWAFGWGHELRAFDLQDGRPLGAPMNLETTNPIWVSDAGPDRAVLYDNGLAIVAVDPTTMIAREWAICGGGGTRAVAATAGPGPYVIAACPDGAIHAYDPDGAELRVTPFGEGEDIQGIGSLAISRDGGTYIAGGSRDVVFVIDGRTGAIVHRWQGPSGLVHQVAFARDERAVLFAGGLGGARLWHLDDGRVDGPFPERLATFVRSSADGTLLTSVGRDIARWHLPATPTPARHVAAAGVSMVALSPDGETLALALGSGRVELRDRRSGRQVGVIEQGAPHVVKAATWSWDGAHIVVAAMGAPGLHVYDARTLAFERVLDEPRGVFKRVVALRDGRVVATNYGQTVRAWHVDGGPVQVLGDAGGAVADMNASADGRAVALVTTDGAVWRHREGDAGILRVATVQGAVAVDVFQGGERVVVAAHDELQVLDAVSGEVVQVILRPSARTQDLQLSPDGRWLAVADHDGTVRLASLEDSAYTAILRGHGERVASVAFSRDGRWLVSGSWDYSARVWPVESATGAHDPDPAELERTWGITLDDALDARTF